MKRTLVTLILALLALIVSAQTTIRNEDVGREEAMQQKQMAASVAERPGVDFDKFRLPVGAFVGGSRFVGREAAKAGWGTSVWDKGEYYPGMDVEAHRRIAKKVFIKEAFRISLIAVVAIAAVIALIHLVRWYRKRAPKKELLIYFRTESRSDNTESKE